MLMYYVFTLDSVFKSAPPKGSELMWQTSMLFSNIVLLIYVNERLYICMEICLSSRYLSVILWPGITQFSSVAQSCPTLCNPMNHSTPGLHHQLLEFTQTHVHWVGDTIQPFHPLSSPSPPALNLSQHQGLFSWVSSSHQVAKVLVFQF